MDLDNLDNLDFDQAEEAVNDKLTELDNEVALEADNDCGDGGCVI